MDRRTFVPLVGVCALTPVGVYLLWDRSPDLPRGMDVVTLYTDGIALAEAPRRKRGLLAAGEADYKLVSNNSDANRVLSTEEPVASFVSNTDFNESYIAIVQHGMNSASDLELVGIQRMNGNIRVNLSKDTPFFGHHDDLIVHTMLLRITDKIADQPESISVHID